MTGIDPKVIHAVVALIIVGVLVETIDQVSSGAAWVLAIILVLGALLFTPQITATLSGLGVTLGEGLV